MKISTPTRELRRKLHITQTELGLLADVNKSMIAQHEAGRKNVNLRGSSKIGALIYAFEAKSANLEQPAAPTEADRSAQLSMKRCELLLQLHEYKLRRAQRKLDALDASYDELTHTLSRLTAMRPGDDVLFTADDRDWLRIVERRLELKAQSCTGEQRLKLRMEVAALEGKIEVLRFQIGVLVEAFNEQLVVGSTDHLAVQPREESLALEVDARWTDDHRGGFDLLPEQLGADLLRILNEPLDEIQKRTRLHVGGVREVSRETLLEPANHGQGELLLSELVLHNQLNHAALEAPLLPHQFIDARIAEGGLTEEHPRGAETSRVEVVHRQIEPHVEQVAVIDERLRIVYSGGEQVNRPRILAGVAEQGRLEQNRSSDKRMPLAGLPIDERAQLVEHRPAAVEIPRAVARVGLHVEELGLDIRRHRREAAGRLELVVGASHEGLDHIVALDRGVGAADDRDERQLQMRVVGLFGTDVDGFEHWFDDRFGLGRTVSLPHHLQFIMHDGFSAFDFAEGIVGTGVGFPAFADIGGRDFEQTGMIDEDQVNIFEQRIAA